MNLGGTMYIITFSKIPGTLMLAVSLDGLLLATVHV